jgi:uncharacterized membrane protein YfcA
MGLELIIAGILVGAISGFFGVGGGMILVPILMYLGFDIKEAIGISIIQMVFSSLYGSFLNYKKGILKISSTIFFGLGGFIGALGSGFIVHHLSEKTLSYIFLAVIMFAIYRFFNASERGAEKPIVNRALYLAIGVMIGMFATSIGIGGAVVLTPIMVGFLHHDIKTAVSTALFFVVFSSISGLISLSSYGYIDYKHGILVGVASLIGVYIGIHLAHKTDAKRHKNMILALYIFVFVMMINKLLGN